MTFLSKLLYKYPLVYELVFLIINFPLLDKKYFLLPELKGRVLEIGCGTGKSSKVLEKQPIDLLCMDINKEFLKFNKKRGRAKKLVLGSAFKLPFKNKTFDCIVIIDTFHHLTEHELLFKECNRVLVKRGSVTIYDPVVCNAENKLINHFGDGLVWNFDFFEFKKRILKLATETGFNLNYVKKVNINTVVQKFTNGLYVLARLTKV